MSTAGCTIESLHVYPIKSCGGITLDSATLRFEGLEHDRQWMLVDARSRFITQREHPELARVAVEIAGSMLQCSVYGHGSVRIPLGPTGGARRWVRVWDDEVEANDCGDEAADWFSDLLGKTARLTRFASGFERRCDPRWAPQPDARTRFSDGYPLLILGSASVADLAARMGRESLEIARFRPNLVLAGTPAYEEDFYATLRCGEVELELVKACARCTIPSIDPATGASGPADPLAALMRYRFDARVGGATLGVNAIVARGAGGVLRRGQPVIADPAFDAGPA